MAVRAGVTATQVVTTRAPGSTSGTGPVAALTFDDGPNPGETEELLDFLRDAGITAVFCVIGANVRAPGGADVLHRTVAEAHVLANLRAAIRPGEVTLAHDGGGERCSTVRAVRRVVTEKLAEGWTFTLPQIGMFRARSGRASHPPAARPPGVRTIRAPGQTSGTGHAAGRPAVA